MSKVIRALYLHPVESVLEGMHRSTTNMHHRNRCTYPRSTPQQRRKLAPVVFPNNGPHPSKRRYYPLPPRQPQPPLLKTPPLPMRVIFLEKPLHDTLRKLFFSAQQHRHFPCCAHQQHVLLLSCVFLFLHFLAVGLGLLRQQFLQNT